MEQNCNTEECFWQHEPKWGYRLILYKQRHQITVIRFVYMLVLHCPALKPAVSVRNEPLLKVTTTPETLTLPMPPLLELTQVGVASYLNTICLTWRKLTPLLSFLFQPDQYMDVFVTLAHDPGHFVLQPWLDMHKLTILMGDMFLYYTRKWTGSSTICVQKGEVYAAKVGKK